MNEWKNCENCKATSCEERYYDKKIKKPCPFCGSDNIEIREKKVHCSDWFGKKYRIMYAIKCKNCSCTFSKLCPCKERLKAIWNKRAEVTK